MKPFAWEPVRGNYAARGALFRIGVAIVTPWAPSTSFWACTVAVMPCTRPYAVRNLRETNQPDTCRVAIGDRPDRRFLE